MKLSKWEFFSLALFILLLAGISLFTTFLFWNAFLAIIGLSFLVVSIVGIVLVRRHFSILKRTNPEVIEALRAESAQRHPKEVELNLKDLPFWLTALLLFIVVVSFLGWMGAYRFSPVLEATLGIAVIVCGVYYFFHKRKLTRKKRSESDEAQTKKD